MRLTQAGQNDHNRRTRQNAPGFELGAIAQESWDYQHTIRNRRDALATKTARWTPSAPRTEREYRNLDAIKVRCLAQKLQRENRASGPMLTEEGEEMIAEMQMEVAEIIRKYLARAKNLQNGS